MRHKLATILELAAEPAWLWGLITWPKFSVTSYRMVSTLARQHIAPRTVIDVGANVGQFAVAASKIFGAPHLHCFEPLPDCVMALRANLRSMPNALIDPRAVGERESVCSMRVNSYSPSSSLLPLGGEHRAAFPGAREVSTTTVEVTTLDRALDPYSLEAPILLKVDVQGYEAAVIAGGRRLLRVVDYAVIETSLKPMYQDEPLFIDIVRVMEDLGFRFAGPVGCLRHPVSYEMLQLDALFERVVRADAITEAEPTRTAVSSI